MKSWKETYNIDLQMTGIRDLNFFAKIGDRRFKFYKSLRKTEYYYNNRNKSIIHKFYANVLRFHHNMLCDKYNWTIPINVFGPGLQIVHTGTIVVSGDAKIGKNCRIHVFTNIGRAETGQGIGAPIIGDNVYIGPGVKIFGPVNIADNTIIGANAVVNKNFNETGCTIAGIPAEVIKYREQNK